MPSLRWASGQGAFRVPPVPPCRSSGSVLFRRCVSALLRCQSTGMRRPHPAMLLLYATIPRRPCSCRLHIFPVCPLGGRPALWFCTKSVLAGVLSRFVLATPTVLPGPFPAFSAMLPVCPYSRPPYRKSSRRIALRRRSAGAACVLAVTISSFGIP